jgi:anti-sigma regulatory factor (Ser/Thr protein kinase)
MKLRMSVTFAQARAIQTALDNILAHSQNAENGIILIEMRRTRGKLDIFVQETTKERVKEDVSLESRIWQE